jgi:hypothetical protein
MKIILQIPALKYMTHPDDSVKYMYRHEKKTPCQGVTKRFHLSWLTNSALVYEPKCGGREGVAGSQTMSTAVHRSTNKLTPYITYASYDQYMWSTATTIICYDGWMCRRCWRCPVWSSGATPTSPAAATP